MLIQIIPIIIIAQSNYYIATAANGGSDSNDGSLGSPWLTLAHATSEVTTANSIIHIGAGSFTETVRSELAVGVSIEGAGVASTTIYTSIGGAYETEALIALVSGTVNTDGNQHISGIAFNGNDLEGYSCIWVRARGNVSIYNCSFTNFLQSAVTFSGRVSGGGGEVTSWCVGNKFYNNTITNCSRLNVGDWYSGCLQIGAQDQMEIYGNTITQNTRGDSQNGYCIKYWEEGYNKGLKIYENDIIKAPSTEFYNDWNFAIELWNYRGGVEIYDNTIEGSIDIDHVQKGSYDFGLKVYRNVFGYETLPPSSGAWVNLSSGLYIEFSCDDIYIYQNEFKNLECILNFSPRSGDVLNNIQVYYNLMRDIGNTSTPSGCNIMHFAGSNFSVDSLIIRNNTIYSGDHGTAYGFIVPEETFTNLRFENNIIQGFDTEAFTISGNNIDGLWIRNNDFYDNGDDINISGSPANYTNSGNITSIPNFTNAGTDFTLTVSSLNIDVALDFGYTLDKRGYAVPVNAIPDIGAYEYGAQAPTSDNDILKFNGKTVVYNGKIVKY